MWIALLFHLSPVCGSQSVRFLGIFTSNPPGARPPKFFHALARHLHSSIAEVRSNRNTHSMKEDHNVQVI